MEDNSEVIDRPTEAPIVEPPKKSLSDLANELEAARAEHASAVRALEVQTELTRAAALAEREAYRAFNDAVAAMKPKRKSPTPRAAKPEAEKKPSTPKAPKPKK